MARLGYQDLTGKTITKMVERSSYIAFLFSDNTTIAICAESDGLELADITFETVEEFDLLALGAITQEEFARRDAAYKEACKQRRRAEFERLKKEFEP